MEFSGHQATDKKRIYQFFWISFFSILFCIVEMKMNSIWCESFWISDDYAMLSMAHAINLEWRLNDRVCYPAPSLAGHPGVPFYIASWLAMKFSFPISSTGF
jgi:hypothetical protein